ncbi:MAG: hypothetical protein Q8Q09_15100 [Deltaproteobacteria bacterium]|nr:hypothetical protein [Deltaproteobacteria bacterium]
MTRHQFVGLVALGALAGCGGTQTEARQRAVREPINHIQSTTSREDQSRCDATLAGRSQSEYDTNNDGVPDVRRVFVTSGEGHELRSTLICREADLNGDGRKDIFRFYNEEGRTLREEEDRNFDGRIDVISFFDRGEVVRREFDSNGDGQVDMRIFYRNRRPYRAERELNSDNTPNFRADYWEYFDATGRVVRIGWDYNGDERADQWDRTDRITPTSGGSAAAQEPSDAGVASDAAAPRG